MVLRAASRMIVLVAASSFAFASDPASGPDRRPPRLTGRLQLGRKLRNSSDVSDFWVKQNGSTRSFDDDSPAECKRAVGCPPYAPVIACESKGIGYAVERAAAHLRGFFPPD